MSNYTKLTDFASKDTLPSGNAAKIVKGTEINDEFEAIETAIATKANADDTALTGIPTAPTAVAGTNTTQIATTAFVTTAVNNAEVGANEITANELNVSGNGTTSQFLRSDGDGSFTWADGYDDDDVASLFNVTGSTAAMYACRVWCNFNASSGTPIIRDDGNVSSITDNGVGDYTFNFTVAMPDNDFTAIAQAHGQGDHVFVGGVVSAATGNVRMYFGDTGVVGSTAMTRKDAEDYGIAVFR
jgi:hypothetical protein